MARDISDPANLTEKQRAFAAAYLANGGDATNAYRQVYDCRSMNPNSINREAFSLSHHPGVRAAIGKAPDVPQEVGRRADEPADFNKHWLLRETAQTYRDAQRAGQPSAAKNALELIGKLTGILVERKELRIIRSVEDLSDEELAAITGGKTIEGIAEETTE